MEGERGGAMGDGREEGKKRRKMGVGCGVVQSRVEEVGGAEREREGAREVMFVGELYI